MDALAALRLQLEWGADEALAEAPVDRRTSAPGAGPPAPAAAVAAEPYAAPPRAANAPVPAPETAPRETTSRAAGARAPAARTPPARPVPAATPAAQRAADIAAAATTIAELRAALAAFDGCDLRTTATQLVFADGNPDAGLVFIGEAPGVEEDRAGLPFVGPSGRFLDTALASIGLDRTRFLITNILPWRPPGNRNPTEGEILACLPFLLRHLALLRPRRIVLLGATATRALTGQTQGITRLRGRWLSVQVPGLDRPVPALPTLHPAYLLRNLGARRDLWTDLVLLRRTLDADNAESNEIVTEPPRVTP